MLTAAWCCALAASGAGLADRANGEGDVSPGLVYRLGGQATGFGFHANRRNLLPVQPLVDVGVPRVSAVIDSAPSAVARAAPADPGVAAGLSGAAPAATGLPPGFVPPYPLFADSSYPVGDRESFVGQRHRMPLSAEAAFLRGASGEARAGASFGSAVAELAEMDSEGLLANQARTIPMSANQRAAVKGLFEQADTVLARHGVAAPRAEPSGVFLTFGAARATVRVERDRNELVGVARSILTDVTLLGGLVTFAAIESELSVHWSGPSQQPVLERRYTFGDARIAGVEAGYDGGMLHFAGRDAPAAGVPLAELLTELFAGRARVSVDRSDADANSSSLVPLSFEFTGEFQPGEFDSGGFSLGAISLRYFSSEAPLPEVSGAPTLVEPPSRATPGGEPNWVSPPLAQAPAPVGNLAVSVGQGTPGPPLAAFPPEGAAVEETGPGSEAAAALPAPTAALAGRSAARLETLGRRADRRLQGAMTAMVLGGLAALGLVVAGRFRLYGE